MEKATFSNKLRSLKRSNKTIITISAILMMFIAQLMLAMPLSVAQTDQSVKTTAFVAVVPNPVGVGQEVSINLFIQPLPPSGEKVFHNLELTITNPDGTSETRGPITTVTTGTQFLTFVPTQVGTYKFKLTYPGEYYAAHQFYPNNVTYEPSESPVTELVVQQEPIAYWPGVSFPTEYWTRPISGEFREWAPISGNWLMHGYNYTYPSWAAAGAYNPYSQAIRAPHIMWTKELAFGGITGGEYGSTSYYQGLSYESKMTPIIMNGVLFYNLRLGSSSFQGFAAVDLRTGQELYRNMNATIKVGQLLNFITGNQMGVIPYLWGDDSTNGVTTSPTMTGTYRMYDAFSGQLITSFANASSGPIMFGPSGEMLVYVFNPQGRWVAMWNSTLAFEKQNPPMVQPYAESLLGLWRPRAGTYDWLKGIQWNTTNPSINMTIGTNVYYPSVIGITGDVLVAFAGETGFPGRLFHAGYSINDGRLLWSKEQPWDEHFYEGWAISFGEGMYTQFDPRSMKFIAYDANTGTKKWESDPMEYPWGSFTTRHMSLIADGKLFGGGYDGYIHAYDLQNGKELWKFFSGNSGLETPYGTWPFFHGLILADGVLYTANGEHSPTQPLIRGERLFAIDAESGQEIWNITGFSPVLAIADGILITYDAYDNRIYAYGKGPTSTEVTAPDVAIPLGSSVVIRGTVIDVSSGAKQNDARFPNGVAAVSDQSLSRWMEYVYMQKPKPTSISGVPVTIEVIDSNNNRRPIGNATSDSSGMFTFTWKPDIEGSYIAIATFSGSEGYWPSYAETSFAVEPAATTQATTQTTATSAIDDYLLPGIIAIIITIIIVGAVLLVAIRRKP